MTLIPIPAVTQTENGEVGLLITVHQPFPPYVLEQPLGVFRWEV